MEASVQDAESAKRSQENSVSSSVGRGRRESRLTLSTQQNATPMFYIGGHNGASLVEASLLELGWKKQLDKTSDHWKLRWTECISQINYACFRDGEQMVNHIPNCGLITNKLGMLMSLRDYDRMVATLRLRQPNFTMNDFFPETYIIDDKREREMFLSTYKDGEIWINKPTGLNQGKGITLIRGIEEFQHQLSERDTESQNNPRGIKARIIQRYIQNPLLLEGRKFDIRCYMLIANSVPYLLLYHPGYIRLSMYEYSNQDTNLVIHLTNQFIQKKDPNYQQVKNDTIWSMEKFNDCINSTYVDTKGIEKDWAKNYLDKQMQKIILHIFNAVKGKLAARVGFFELYGLDFMIDQNMKVWFIEANVNPSLQVNCDTLKDVLPPMVDESLNIAIECFEKARKGKALMPLQSLQTFSVLYSDSASGRQRASSQNSLRYWVAPRYRSSSTSPQRSQSIADDAASPPTRHSQNVPPVVTPLPRVALAAPRNFENSLRRYTKSSFATGNGAPSRSNTMILSAPRETSAEETQQPSKEVAVQKLTTKSPAQIPNSPHSATDKNKATLSAETLVYPSSPLVSPSSQEQPTATPGPVVQRHRVVMRPSPPARAPAPVTTVQVVTGGTTTVQRLPTNLSNLRPGPPRLQQGKQRARSPLDRSG